MSRIISLIGSHKVTLLYALAFVLVFVIGYVKGDADRSVKEARKQTQAIERGVQIHGKIQQKIMALPDPDLDARLSKWLRD